MSLALYRKYRPKKFADLVGQEDLRDVLQNAAREDRFAHAYLFYGGRGTGKTTTARIIAKVVNCEKRVKDASHMKLGEPCNECRACVEIDAGRALDVIEIDAASNRGVDDARALKEGIKLSPTMLARKVFIIDEMHMLTREAFNALLKTLEEPPAHAIIILATTEYDKVPATISSRAQRFHFRKLSVSNVVKKLKFIVGKEKLDVKDDALEIIAATSEGSLRDAESLLDQVISFSGSVDAASVSHIIGRVGYRTVADFAELLVNKNLTESLRYSANLYNEGHNIVDLNKELIVYLRRVLALKCDPSLEALFAREITSEELKRIKAISAVVDIKFLTGLMRSLIRAWSEMRYSPLSIAPLEVAIVENLKTS